MSGIFAGRGLNLMRTINWLIAAVNVGRARSAGVADNECSRGSPLIPIAKD